MFQYRQALVRLRAGDSVREIARSGLMGRDKLAQLLALAVERGWLEAASDVPEDGSLAAALGARKRVAASTVSSAEPHRAVIERWVAAGVQGRAIHAALKREHGYAGSYSAVVRIVRPLRAEQPPEVTVRLECAGRRRAGGLRRRPDAAAPGWPRAAHLGVRGDAGAQPPPIRRVRVGPDGGHLAGLPPSGIRVVRRRAQPPRHRQRQVRHREGLHARPAGAARLCRMRRRLRLQDRRVPAARSAEEGVDFIVHLVRLMGQELVGAADRRSGCRRP